jgi:phage nucleotide-binding protein
MTVNITSTKRDTHYVKFAVYGQAGVGKTVLCSTAPKPIILSAEAGLLSLANTDIPVIEIKSLADLQEAYGYLKASNTYETVCLDSISDIAEQVLDAKMNTLEEKARETGKSIDPRQGYGGMATEMLKLTRAFRLLDCHIVFTAKQGMVTDAIANTLRFGPMLPGQVFTQNMPYLVDIVAAMRVAKDGERYLQTQPDLQYMAKDRSGKLDKAEKPDLTAIIKKVTNSDYAK